MRTGIRIALLVGLVAALLSIAGCADPQDEQVQRLDDAIHDVESAIGRYYTVDPQGPVSDLETATDRVSSAWERALAESAGLDDVDMSEAQLAFEALTGAVADLPTDITAAEGLAILEPYIEAFDDEVEEIHDSLDVH